MNIVNINSDESTVKVPWCTHCKRPYHNKDNCFILHPYTQKRSNDRTDTEASVKGETLIKPIPITQLNPSSSWQLQGYSNTSRIDLSLTRHAPNTYPPDAATL